MRNRNAAGAVRAACLVLACVLAAAPAARAEDVDRTVAVTRGTRLDVRLFGGEVIVRGWDRSDVRVRATMFRTDTIDIRREAQSLRVGARASQGAPHAIDVQIDAPSWMALEIRGTYLDITVAGVRAGVTAETVRGDVRVDGADGPVTLRSIEGSVTLDRARGRVTLSTVNNDIRVSDVTGDVFADSVSGAVTLRRVTAQALTASTVSGDISWDGLVSASGRYQFATHGGDVDVALGEGADASVVVRPFAGRFRATFPLPLPDGAATNRKIGFVLGSGGARLEIETFSGTITFRRPG